jgi:hypothetical protein
MTDPDAVRARTHRPTTFLPDCSVHQETCRRCDEPWPCPEAGQVDPETSYRWALLAGAIVALWCLTVGVVGWLAGWWF